MDTWSTCALVAALRQWADRAEQKYITDESVRQHDRWISLRSCALSGQTQESCALPEPEKKEDEVAEPVPQPAAAPALSSVKQEKAPVRRTFIQQIDRQHMLARQKG